MSNLMPAKFAPLADFESGEGKRPDFRSDELEDGEADGFDHAPDFTVFPLCEHDLEPAVFPAVFGPTDARGPGEVPPLHAHTGPKAGDSLVIDARVEFDDVSLGHLRFRARDDICEFGIVRQKEQAGSVLVEPADR